MHPYVHKNTTYSSQDMEEQAKCPLTDECTKMWCIYIHTM